MSEGIKRNGRYVKTAGNIIAPSSDLTPTGTILNLGGNTVPVGYLKCDGSEISRTDYSDLFNAIGTTYGDGDGTTTFNLPDIEIPIEGMIAVIKSTKVVSKTSYDLIDDNKSVNNKTWSSSKIESKVNELIKKSQTTIGNITVGANNYAPVNTGVPVGHTIIGWNVRAWSSNNGGWSVIPYADNGAYIVANSGTTITNLSITWFYI